MKAAQKAMTSQYSTDSSGDMIKNVNPIISGGDVANAAIIAKELKTANDLKSTAEAASAAKASAGMSAGSLAIDKANQAGAFGGKESTGNIAAQTGSMALTGASIGGGYGAASGAAAGLTVGLLGAATAKKERERKAASEYYANLASIEGAKQDRIARAQQNMANAIGQTLLSNSSIRL